MVLEVDSKPIRIRIISGGEEHSSLESLRNNFSLKDLMPMVNDGRLVKWLRQKGENAIAENISTFCFQSDISNPDKSETLRFIYMIFPMLAKNSLEQIMEVWYRESERNYHFLVSFLKYVPPLNLIIEWYKTDVKRETDNRNKWRDLFIKTMEHLLVQELIDNLHELLLLRILSDEDLESFFLNRPDCKDGAVYYQIWEVLKDKADYRLLGYRYLRKSAKLGFSIAKKQVNENGSIKLLDQYINKGNLYCNYDDGDEVFEFLKILDKNGADGYSISEYEKQRVGQLSKYCDVVNILWQYKYVRNITEDRIIKGLEGLRERYIKFPALNRIINDFSKDVYIQEFSNRIRMLTYKKYIVYIVKLVKEYEFGLYCQ